MIPEYRGYSLLKKFSASTEQIHEDMEYFIDYLLRTKRTKLSRIILMGRSLGGLFALNLSSKFKVKALVLVSTFYSVKEIVKGKFGNFFSSLFKNDQNEPFELIRNNLNKTLIIHGNKDDMVKVENAEMLFGECKSECHLEIIEDMGHEIHSVFHDLIYPLVKFFESLFKEGEFSMG